MSPTPNTPQEDSSPEALHELWKQAYDSMNAQMDAQTNEAGHEVDRNGLVNMTVTEFTDQGITQCDDCEAELEGLDMCWVDGEVGSLRWVVCGDCYDSNYAYGPEDDERVIPLDIPDTTKDQRSEPMKKMDFFPTNFSILKTVVDQACEACKDAVRKDTAAYFSKDETLCTVCYNKRLAGFNALKTPRKWCDLCKMMDDLQLHAQAHAENSVPPVPWTKEKLCVHDCAEKEAEYSTPCQTCNVVIKFNDEAWFRGPGVADPVICTVCYDKYKPEAGKMPVKEGQQPQQGSMGFSTGYETSWHHTHKPVMMIHDETDTWGVWVGSRDGVIPEANDFDIVFNMSGRTITEKHLIPIPELEKWSRGGDTFTELLLDWPDNGVAYFPLQFWLDLMAHIENKKLKLVAFCIGGHGRTGTALACMLIAGLGWNGTKAIEWVRNNHCKRAIESKEQENYIHSISKQMKEHKKENPEPNA